MSSFVDVIESEQDDWLDITTKEEILQREIACLERALEEKSFELTESNVTIDLLKDHKILIENDQSALQDEICTQTLTLSAVREDLESSINRETSVRNELEAFKTVSESETLELKDLIEDTANDLDLANDNIMHLNQTICNLGVAHKKESGELVELVNKLQGQVATMQNTMREQGLEIFDCKQNAQESASREDILRQQLSKEQNLAEQRVQELKTLRSETGAIAIMAENLRVEKQKIAAFLTRKEATLKRTQVDLQETRAREDLLKAQLLDLELSSEQNILKLTESLNSNSRDLEDSRGMVDTLKSSLGNMRVEMAEVKHSLKAESEKTYEMKEEHEILSHQLAILEQEQKEREEQLQEDLVAAKRETEKRLDELRVILGVRHHKYVAPKLTFGGYRPPIMSALRNLV